MKKNLYSSDEFESSVSESSSSFSSFLESSSDSSASIPAEKEAENKAKQTNDAWREHTRIVKGNPLRVYKGMGFNRND